MMVRETPHHTQVSMPADLRRFQAGCSGILTLSVLLSVITQIGDVNPFMMLLIMGLGLVITAPLMLVMGSALLQKVSQSRWGHVVLFGLALGWSTLGAAPGGLNTGTKLLAWLFVALLCYAALAWSMGHVYRLQLDGKALTMERARTLRTLELKTAGWMRRRKRVIPLESIASVSVKRFPWWPLRRLQVVLEVHGEGAVPIWSGPLSVQEAAKLARKVQRQKEGQQGILQREGHDLSERPQIPAGLQSLRGEKPIRE